MLYYPPMRDEERTILYCYLEMESACYHEN